MPSYWCVDSEEGYSTRPRSERQTTGPGLTEENYYYSLGSNSSTSSGDNHSISTTATTHKHSGTMNSDDRDTMLDAGEVEHPEPPDPVSSEPGQVQQERSVHQVSMDASVSAIPHNNSSNSQSTTRSNFLYGIFGLSASRDSSSASGVPERLSIPDGDGIVHSWTLEQYICEGDVQ